MFDDLKAAKENIGAGMLVVYISIEARPPFSFTNTRTDLLTISLDFIRFDLRFLF